MAKMIEPTPVLKGADATAFLKATLETEKHPDVQNAAELKKCFEMYSRRPF